MISFPFISGRIRTLAVIGRGWVRLRFTDFGRTGTDKFVVISPFYALQPFVPLFYVLQRYV